MGLRKVPILQMSAYSAEQHRCYDQCGSPKVFLRALAALLADIFKINHQIGHLDPLEPEMHVSQQGGIALVRTGKQG